MGRHGEGVERERAAAGKEVGREEGDWGETAYGGRKEEGEVEDDREIEGKVVVLLVEHWGLGLLNFWKIIILILISKNNSLKKNRKKK